MPDGHAECCSKQILSMGVMAGWSSPGLVVLAGMIRLGIGRRLQHRAHHFTLQVMTGSQNLGGKHVGQCYY